MKYLFLDVETTGIDIRKDRLVQICYDFGENVVTKLYRPPIPISVEAMSVTHITNKMVEEYSAFEGDITQRALRDFSECDITLVAHNAAFDVGILRNEGVEFQNYICTLKLARRLDRGEMARHNLQYLRYFFGLEIDAQAHDAEGDVKVLREVFECLVSQGRWTHEEMLRITAEPSRILKFSFGKYKGRMVEEIATFDIGYLSWLLDEKLKNPQGEEDWIFTLRQYIKE